MTRAGCSKVKEQVRVGTSVRGDMNGGESEDYRLTAV
jgi:hypothetical protein